MQSATGCLHPAAASTPEQRQILRARDCVNSARRPQMSDSRKQRSICEALLIGSAFWDRLEGASHRKSAFTRSLRAPVQGRTSKAQTCFHSASFTLAFQTIFNDPSQQGRSFLPCAYSITDAGLVRWKTRTVYLSGTLMSILDSSRHFFF